MKNRDFIITSLQPWDIEIGSTIKNTALEISKTNRVLYINTPMDYSTCFRGNKNAAWKHRMDVVKKRVSPIRQINERMWVADCPFCVFPVGGLPTACLFDTVNRINNKMIADYICKVASRFGFTDYIHLIDTDIYRSQYLKEYIKPALSIYYCRDFVIGQPYWKKNGARLEAMLAAKLDIVLTNSTQFAIRFKKYNLNTFPIETGVNLELYDARKKWEVPEDLKHIPSPIIGYVGSVIALRLDCNLLMDVAQSRSQYNFVFIGPEDETFSNHPLHRLPNVYFLGKKRVETLPAYITGCDVCINPQIINDITDGNYPLKVDEYLAMGKPIVATSTHTMRDIFAEYAYLPANTEEYLQALDAALKECGDKNKEEQRIRFAHTHSWQHSVQKIYNIIEQFQAF